MLFKKGQGATEYLIILAVVIIVALIVVAAMGGIPGIGTGAKERAAESYWASQDIGIDSYAVNSTGYVTLNLRNNLRNSATVTAVSVGGETVSSGDLTLGTGASSSRAGDTSLTCTAGESFSYEVSITYTDDETSASYTLDGDGTKLEGTCSS